jgi:hypothetical protein
MKLKGKRERYVYYKHMNKKNPGGPKATITRGKVFCLRRGVQHDAV